MKHIKGFEDFLTESSAFQINESVITSDMIAKIKLKLDELLEKYKDDQTQSGLVNAIRAAETGDYTKLADLIPGLARNRVLTVGEDKYNTDDLSKKQVAFTILDAIIQVEKKWRETVKGVPAVDTSNRMPGAFYPSSSIGFGVQINQPIDRQVCLLGMQMKNLPIAVKKQIRVDLFPVFFAYAGWGGFQLFDTDYEVYGLFNSKREYSRSFAKELRDYYYSAINKK